MASPLRVFARKICLDISSAWCYDFGRNPLMEVQIVIIRSYRAQDCAEIAQLFYNTVHTVNAKDYTPAQLAVWADGNVDLSAWNHSFLSHETAVAVLDDRIVGFGDMDESGYLDRLYVHKDFQREGIATRICDWLEERVVSEIYTTHASITARPFFVGRGFTVHKEQQVERGGILLTNYVMIRRNNVLR